MAAVSQWSSGPGGTQTEDCGGGEPTGVGADEEPAGVGARGEEPRDRLPASSRARAASSTKIPANVKVMVACASWPPFTAGDVPTAGGIARCRGLEVGHDRRRLIAGRDFERQVG
jgi:hypothetical protein